MTSPTRSIMVLKLTCLVVVTCIIHSSAALVQQPGTQIAHRMFKRSSGSRGRLRTWPGGIMPYDIQTSLQTERIVRQAMKQITDKSCIKFQPYTNETGYLVVKDKSNACWSSKVGYGKKKLMMNFGVGCRKLGKILHELMHVLGFFHEHSRPDRDEYVRVNITNIKKKMKRNYVKFQNYDTLGLPYDYNSILHYNRMANAIDKNYPVITPLNEFSGSLGGGELSSCDIMKINRAYNCIAE